MYNLGERLKKIRKIKGLSQKDMANIMGVTLRAYQRYEKDDQKASYDKVARAINEFRDINPRWLLSGEGDIFVYEGKESETGNLNAIDQRKEKNKILIDQIQDPVAKEVVKLITEGYYTPRVIAEFLSRLKNIKNASIKP